MFFTCALSICPFTLHSKGVHQGDIPAYTSNSLLYSMYSSAHLLNCFHFSKISNCFFFIESCYCFMDVILTKTSENIHCTSICIAVFCYSFNLLTLDVLLFVEYGNDVFSQIFSEYCLLIFSSDNQCLIVCKYIL